MGPKEFAVRTAKPEKTIIAIIKGESSITADMAVQFESVTKIPAHFWLNSQRAYDEYVAHEKRNEMIAQSVEWARKFLLSSMIKKGWLVTSSSSSNIKEKTTALLSIILGRFLHRKLLPFSVGSKLIVPIKIEHELEN